MENSNPSPCMVSQPNYRITTLGTEKEKELIFFFQTTPYTRHNTVPMYIYDNHYLCYYLILQDLSDKIHRKISKCEKVLTCDRYMVYPSRGRHLRQRRYPITCRPAISLPSNTRRTRSNKNLTTKYTILIKYII